MLLFVLYICLLAFYLNKFYSDHAVHSLDFFSLKLRRELKCDQSSSSSLIELPRQKNSYSLSNYFNVYSAVFWQLNK